MAYTKKQIEETVDYIAEAIFEKAFSAATFATFKEDLFSVLSQLTLDIPKKSRPKEVEFSQYSFRSQDNPLNTFFKDCDEKGITFPPRFSVVLRRNGESLDLTDGDPFVIYENIPEIEEEDSYVDAFTFRKEAGKRSDNFLKRDKDCPRLIKPSIPDSHIQKDDLEETPVSHKRKDEKEKFFSAQHREADGYQVVDRRSKVKAAHKHQPKVYAPAYSHYKQVNPGEVIGLAVAFTQLQMSRALGFRK